MMIRWKWDLLKSFIAVFLIFIFLIFVINVFTWDKKKCPKGEAHCIGKDLSKFWQQSKNGWKLFNEGLNEK